MGAFFDITDECEKFIRESIKDMPGNNGQETLVKNLDIDGYCYIDYEASIPVATAIYDWDIESTHPDAIKEIIKHAYESAEVIAKQAETILPVFSPDKWIIAGWNG
jgi:hypothetical protein